MKIIQYLHDFGFSKVIPFVLIFLVFLSFALFGIENNVGDLSSVFIGFITADITFAAVYYGVFAKVIDDKTESNAINQNKIYSYQSLLLIISMIISHIAVYIILKTNYVGTTFAFANIIITSLIYSYFSIFIFTIFMYRSKLNIYRKATKFMHKNFKKMKYKTKISNSKRKKIENKVDLWIANAPEWNADESSSDKIYTIKEWVILVTTFLGEFKFIIERFEIGAKYTNNNLINTFVKKSVLELPEKETKWIFNIFIEKTTKILSKLNEGDFDFCTNYLTINKNLSSYWITIFNLKLSLDILILRKDQLSLKLFHAQLMTFVEIINYYMKLNHNKIKSDILIRTSLVYNDSTFKLSGKIKNDLKILKIKNREEMVKDVESSVIMQSNFSLSLFVKDNLESIKKMIDLRFKDPLLLLGWESIIELLNETISHIENNPKIKSDNKIFFIKLLLGIYENHKENIFKDINFKDFKLKTFEDDQVLKYIYENKFLNHDYNYSFDIIMAMLDFSLNEYKEQAMDTLLFNDKNVFEPMNHISQPVTELIIASILYKTYDKDQLKIIDSKMKEIIIYNKRFFSLYSPSEYAKKVIDEFEPNNEKGFIGLYTNRKNTVDISKGISKELVDKYAK